MKKSIVILSHTGYWLGYWMLPFLILLAVSHGTLGLLGEGPTVMYIVKLLLSFLIVPSLFAFYVAYSPLFSNLLQQQKVKALVGWSLVSCLGAALVGVGVISALFGIGFMMKDGFTSFFSEMAMMFVFGLVNTIIGLVLRGFFTWYEEIQMRQELTRRNHEMELELVKAQLDPHFLFNTIQNIDMLIRKNPEVASDYLNRLSDIMRFMLFEAKDSRIPLETEVEYIRKFVDLQKIRTTNSEYVTLDIVGDTNKMMIAPMLLIPFIENAFKHTRNKKLTDAIVIRLEIRENNLLFNCVNKLGSIEEKKGHSGGLGNELIEKRLQLLYPNRHQLELNALNESYEVKLSLQAA